MFDSASLLLLLFATLLFLGIATAVFSGLGRLDGRSALVVTTDEASEVLELFPLVVKSAAAQRERANELSQGERSLLEALLAELGQHVLASFLDRAR